MLLIGKITRPHGVKGEVKVQAFTDEPSNLKNIPNVYVGGISYAVKNVKFIGGFAVMKLEGVDTAEQADALRNQEMSAQRKDMPHLPEGRHYIIDLIGCKVFAGNLYLGVLVDIFQKTTIDVYSVAGERNVMFPVIEKLIIDIDIINKKIELNEELFLSVAVYED